MMQIGDVTLSQEGPLTFILGPCVIESEAMALEIAHFLKENLTAPFIFKASYDKANRTSFDSFRGPGLEKGLAILQTIKERYKLPVTTDLHHPDEAHEVASVCDLLQIPAFLCRQTDLIHAAAKTGKPVNVKKGQFLSPYDTKAIVEKIHTSGNPNVILTERGSSFGYQNLVVDMRSFSIMKQFTPYVCFDASHSVQLPGGEGRSSGGDRNFIPQLAKAALASGANLIFLETHPDPNTAKSDAKTQWPLRELPPLVKELCHFHKVLESYALAES